MAVEIPSDSAVLDLFTGSSVVAQGLARAGNRVAAHDALGHCVTFAEAMLGVGRSSDGAGVPASETLLAVADQSWVDAWAAVAVDERDAVEQGDADSLLRLATSVPQLWRMSRASRAQLAHFGSMRPGRTTAGLVTAHYAGTYFGVQQAIDIDLLRLGIAQLDSLGQIDRWQKSVLLTALLSAASDAVFSAGKHYAQPHRIRTGKDLTFLRGRIQADRSKSIVQLFSDRLAVIVKNARPPEGHLASQATLETLLAKSDRLPKYAVVYADPPYTAQQYSRFYHVPEVIFDYRVPDLQIVRGAVTRGLYPTERFKSRFCSRRQAPAAFADLCRLTRAVGGALLLSYSYSRSGETGNQRSIALPDLRRVLRSHFRTVREEELPISYRQFNSSGSAVEARRDPELLLVAR